MRSKLEHERTAVMTSKATAARQIAILLRSLPERTHRVLLGQLAVDEIQQIQAELAQLGEVDALERHRTLQRMHEALRAETQSVDRVESEIQDEIQIGRARVGKKRGAAVYGASEATHRRTTSGRVAESPVSDTAASRPGDADRATTAERDEASVAASVFGTQTDVVAGHDLPAPESLRSLFAQFQQTQAAGVLPVAAGAVAGNDGPSGNAGPAGPVSAGWDEGNTGRPDHASAWPDSAAERVLPEQDPEMLAEQVDRYLMQLSPQQLCRALGMVSTKEAFLVLCGLPNETAETVLGKLPRRKSRKVRSEMRRMGQLQLCEIDRAKQAVAEIAIRMTTEPTLLAA
jgi:FtsZ-binding cell division protein ZapB